MYNPMEMPVDIIEVDVKDPFKIVLDKAGFFVIIPNKESMEIYVEHYSNLNELLRVIKGSNAKDIYWAIIDNGWITEISHAAYIGKELTLAELSLSGIMEYNQGDA